MSKTESRPGVGQSLGGDGEEFHVYSECRGKATEHLTQKNMMSLTPQLYSINIMIVVLKSQCNHM